MPWFAQTDPLALLGLRIRERRSQCSYSWWELWVRASRTCLHALAGRLVSWWSVRSWSRMGRLLPSTCRSTLSPKSLSSQGSRYREVFHYSRESSSNSSGFRPRQLPWRSGGARCSRTPIAAAAPEDRRALLERFLHLRPPTFSSDRDPDRADSWVHELERTFETMDCAELDQVRLAVYQLKGSTHEWWRAVRQTSVQGRRLDQITWEEVLVAFHAEFLPDYVCRERRDLFHELAQGDLTVGQYHQRFLQLLRYIPHMASSEQARTE
ncbi:hypothetical protein Taro_009153 [Colocasia esculenta]|uniref:Retrotransposon gag domain-containing protein n=1 Tax=Colocasia esculenta TaxID=4460 RepID=A0A843TZC8_COLES|nr:hypothetical protein [Colocasia esculenta]